MSNFLDFLRGGWFFAFFICIIFIFIILFRDLRSQTKRAKKWQRIPYNMRISRFRLTFQHFTRKGELLTTTSLNICKIIHRDLLDYFKAIGGLTHNELENIIIDGTLLSEIFRDQKVVEFIYDIENWLKMARREPSLLEKLFPPIKGLFKEQSAEEELYMELIFVIANFRKALESRV